MSARDDQPITVPPPDGEDDAYNATTKVGAMPEEMMAKLRAEGLLPPEVDEPPAVPSSKSRRFADPVAPRDDGPVAVLYSSTPPADHESPPSAPIPAAPPPPVFAAEPAPPPPVLAAEPAPPAVPPSVAPAAPASLAPVQPSQPPVVAVEPADPVVPRETQAFGGRFTRGQMIIGVIAALGALVAFAFLMALMSQRR
jgi:hypothetical protein